MKREPESETAGRRKGEGSEGSRVSRRTFLGISSGAAAAVAIAYSTKWPKIGPESTPDNYEEGVHSERWVATSCLNCPSRCAINVRVVNGSAVRIIGNHKSAYSGGKICPRSYVGLQVLYNPERTSTPMKRTNPKGRGKDPGWVSISWDEAMDMLSDKLNAIKSKPEDLLLIQGLNTTSDEDLLRRFAKAYGTPNLLSEEAMETGPDQEGKRMADGRGDGGYDLENANYVLAFGANIVESERPLARNLQMWGWIRRGRPNRAKVVVIDPRYSVTAAKADEWIPIKPNTDGALAMAIAHVIISEGLYDANFINDWTSGFNAYKSRVLNDFSPETVSLNTGVNVDTIVRIAREFAQSRPAIAWSGLGASSWPYGSHASHAIFCLNALVGGIDAKGGIVYQEPTPYTAMVPAMVETEPASISLRTAKERLDSTEAVIGFNSNLMASVPETSRWDEALAKVPFYAHIGPSWNETAQYADIVLPSCTYLEEWGYESSLPGSGFAEVKIKQPVVPPMHSSRPIAQIVFDLASDLMPTASNAFRSMGNNPEGFVKYRTGDFVSWETFKADGVWKGPDHIYGNYAQIFETASGKFEFQATDMGQLLNSEAEFVGGVSDYPLKLVIYHPVLDVRSGSQNYPWAQEMFLVMHGYGWNNFAEMNRQTAHDLKIDDGDMVWVESWGGKRIKAKARVFEGIRPGVLAMATGQGHYACGEWADGMGTNPNEIISLNNGIRYDNRTGQPCFFNTRVKIYKA